jgi:pimeloyl-ACP methyl ester carboxylesterase
MIDKRVQAQTAYAHEEGANEGLRAQLAARALHDCHDRLSEITAETLVLAGIFDGQADQDVQRRMARQIPSAQFAEVQGGHGFLFETSEAYEKMIAFLTR